MTLFLEKTLSGALFFLLIASCAIAEAKNFSWHPSGYGGGGRFTSIAVHPSNPDIIFIGSDVAGIFRSRDGGNSFEITGNGLNGFNVSDIAISHAYPHQVFALTDGGLYFSKNLGEKWERLSQEIKYLSRFSGSCLMLMGKDYLLVGTDTNGVFRIPLNNPRAAPESVMNLRNIKINGLAFYKGQLYAGTSQGVFRLEEKGWNPRNSGGLTEKSEISDIASLNDYLYVLEKHGGLFFWNSRSGSWEKRPVNAPARPKSYKSLLIHPENPETVLIGSHPENWPHILFITQNSGKTWRSVDSFQTNDSAPVNWTQIMSGIEEMAFVPGTTIFFLTDWWNVWKSPDYGKNWFQKHKGLQNTVVNDIKIHPWKPEVIFLCAADNGLMISKDSGKSWQRSMKGIEDGHAQEIEISRNDPSRMILLMNPWKKRGRVYVYESRDSGRNWKDIGFPIPVEALPKFGFVDGLATNVEIDPVSEGTIYVGTNGYGVYKTIDSGQNWIPMNEGLMTPYIKGQDALLVHPRFPDTLFASTQAGGIYKSTNSANTWQRVTAGKQFTFGMSIDPNNSSRIIAGCAGNRLLISNDEGKSWQETRLPFSTSSELAVFSVAFHPKHSGTVLAGTIRYDIKATEGLFISTDSAKSFKHIKMELPRININTIRWLNESLLSGFLGFNGIGIFRIESGENP